MVEPFFYTGCLNLTNNTTMMISGFKLSGFAIYKMPVSDSVIKNKKKQLSVLHYRIEKYLVCEREPGRLVRKPQIQGMRSQPGSSC